jgi:hypothetical protein
MNADSFEKETVSARSHTQQAVTSEAQTPEVQVLLFPAPIGVHRRPSAVPERLGIPKRFSRKTLTSPTPVEQSCSMKPREVFGPGFGAVAVGFQNMTGYIRHHQARELTQELRFLVAATIAKVLKQQAHPRAPRERRTEQPGHEFASSNSNPPDLPESATAEPQRNGP